VDATDDATTQDQAWARTLPARAAREAIICGVFGSLIAIYARRDVAGREHLDALDGPVIFVANHCSHVDTPALLRSLPGRWRRRTAVAAAADYFDTGRLLPAAVSLAFCTVPLERRGGASADATEHVERLIAGRWSVVVFAEGTRSRDGRVGRLRSGAAILAAQHHLPIVPIHIAGTHVAMPTGHRWMVRPSEGGRFARHTIPVTFGSPIHVRPGDDRLEVMETIRLFMERCGAQTTPDPKLAARRAAAAAKAAAEEVAERRVG